MNLSLPQIAKALGGDISNGQVLAPGPGHSAKDRSLAVKLGAAGNIVVHSHCDDDAMTCKTYVEGKLGIVWQPDESRRAGGSSGAFARMERRAGKSGRAKGQGAAHEPAPADNRQASALRLWHEAVDPRGTIVETYLASRRLDLPAGVAMSALRFHPTCPFGPGVRLPCMVAAMRSIETGEVVAIHRTALTPDGRKIDRKMLGPADGAAIMLGELDAERGTLTVGEGIESALSGLALGYAPAWAMGTAGGIGKLPVLHGVDSLTILGEHDGGASSKAIRQVGCAWHDAEREVYVAMPKAGLGKDVNDAWQRREGDQAEVLDVHEFAREGDTHHAEPEAQAAIRKPIAATPFRWKDPATIPPRDWVYGEHYIRQFASATISPGAVGKSSLVIVEALAMATGKALLGVHPRGRFKVWLWNGEDPLSELERRVMAAALHYGLTREDFEGWLFIDSGRSTEIIVAEEQRDGVKVVRPIVEEVKATILANKIDVVIIDPFVSSHNVSENDNSAIDRVTKLWGKIADSCNCAVELVHHSRKTNGAEVSVEDARGASSLIAGVRSARSLNPMTEEEAGRAGVELHRRRHFRFDNGKANMAPPPEGSTWFFLASVPLGNGSLGVGDNIAVVEPWTWPAPLDGVSVDDLRKAQQAVSNGRWRENIQAKDWAGIPIAQVLGLDPTNKAHKAKVRSMLQIWIANGMFVVVQGQDEKRNPRSFIEVGELAT